MDMDTLVMGLAGIVISGIVYLGFSCWRMSKWILGHKCETVSASRVKIDAAYLASLEGLNRSLIHEGLTKCESCKVAIPSNWVRSFVREGKGSEEKLLSFHMGCAP